MVSEVEISDLEKRIKVLEEKLPSLLELTGAILIQQDVISERLEALNALVIKLVIGKDVVGQN